MKKKKLLSMVLVGALAFASFTGCGAKEDAPDEKESSSRQEESGGEGEASQTKPQEESAEEPEKTFEPTDISIAIWDVESCIGDGQDPIIGIIEEKTGVHIVPQNTTWDDHEQKIQLWATNGQLPDVFAGGYIGTSFFQNWVEQGVIRALPEDLSAYPNLEEYMQMERAKAARVDGKYYMIPRQTYGDISYSVLDRNIVYRWDLAQKAGVTKEPETWDEFRDMIQKIIEADPEGKNVNGMTAVLPGLLSGVIMPYGNIVELKWVHDGEKFIPSYFEGNLTAAMQLARDMYEEGTIEKDIALTKAATANEKFLQGQSAAMVFAGAGPSWLYSFEADWQQMYGHSMLDDIKIAKLYPGVDGDKYYFVDTEAWSESYVSAKVDDEKMDAICRLYDFLVSEEGRRLIAYGIEGEDYDMVDGRPVLREGVVLSEKYSVYNGSLSSLATWSADSWDMGVPSSKPEGFRQLSEDRHQDAVQNGKLPKYYDAISFMSTPLKDSFVYSSSDDMMTVMMGNEPVDKMVEDLLAGYEEKGLSAMLEEVNQAAKEAGIEP